MKGASLASPAGGGATPAVGIQATIDKNFGSAAAPNVVTTVVSSLFADSQKQSEARADAQKAAELIDRVQHAATSSGREAALAALATLGAHSSGHAGADLGWINAELAKGLNVIASGSFSKAETDRMLAVTGLADGKYQIADPANPAAKAMSATELTNFIAAGANGGFTISTDIPALGAKSGDGGTAEGEKAEGEEAEKAPVETGTKAPVPATGGGTGTGTGATAKDGTGTGATAKDGTGTGATAKDGTGTGATAKDGTGTGTTAKDGTGTGATAKDGTGTDKAAKDGTTAKGAPAAKDPAAKEGKGNIFDETFSSKPHPATENKLRAAEEAANAPAAPWGGGDAGPAPDRGFIARAPALPWVGQEHPVGENANYLNGPENCGPAVLAMLARLRRLYPNLSDADLIMLLAKLAGTTGHGTTGNGMIAALHELGFQTEASKGADLNWIDQQLAQGHEVIANGDFYSVPGRENPKLQAGHYIAITANENGQYTINDPEDANVHTMSAAQLKKFIASHPQGGFALAAW